MTYLTSCRRKKLSARQHEELVRLESDAAAPRAEMRTNVARVRVHHKATNRVALDDEYEEEFAVGRRHRRPDDPPAKVASTKDEQPYRTRQRFSLQVMFGTAALVAAVVVCWFASRKGGLGFDKQKV